MSKSKSPVSQPDEDGVHTSAQITDPAPAPAATGCGCGNCGGNGNCQKPTHHLPTPPRPRDAFTSQGGQYVRDSQTGERKRVDTVKD